MNSDRACACRRRPVLRATAPRGGTNASAIIGFDAPDGGERRRVHPEPALREGERLAPAGHHRAAVVHSFLVDEAREIIPNWRLEFRLDLGKLEHVGIGREPARRFVECCGIDAARLGRAAKSLKAVRKAGGTSLGGREKDEAESEASGGSPHRASVVIEQGVYFPIEQPFSIMR